ncbi:MAG: hypothetical protein QOJ86_2075 [Bradyrhizobium sp.]|nr:hypothetical protein [Bradyrhizobium sp.]
MAGDSCGSAAAYWDWAKIALWPTAKQRIRARLCSWASKATVVEEED